MCKKIRHQVLLASILLTLPLMACRTTTVVTPAAAAPTSAATPAVVTPTAPPAEMPVLVAFVKAGDIQVWDEATHHSETIFTAGDVTTVTMSDDGQVIAFLRRSVVQQTAVDWFEQSALWAVDRDGGNPRELVSAEGLRQQAKATERDSTSLFQMAWIPQTHHLLYSGVKYIVQAEGLSHAYPEGVYVIDTETGSTTTLASTDKSLRFTPSPDGRQIALMSTTRLGFINVDGSNWQPDVLTYPEVGVPVAILPYGVWSQAADAFLIVAPIESESPFVLNFTIWRASLDGSSAEPLATITDDSHPASVTFAPDGQHAAFYRWPEPAWLITPLAIDVGPLAIPYSIDLGYANLHWSPADIAYVFPDTLVGALYPLCPEATQNSEVCGEPINLGGIVAAITWIDSNRFVFLTRDPYTLSLGRLDGATTPIVTWLPEEAAGSQSFAAMLMPPR